MALIYFPVIVNESSYHKGSRMVIHTIRVVVGAIKEWRLSIERDVVMDDSRV